MDGHGQSSHAATPATNELRSIAQTQTSTRPRLTANSRRRSAADANSSSSSSSSSRQDTSTNDSSLSFLTRPGQHSNHEMAIAVRQRIEQLRQRRRLERDNADAAAASATANHNHSDLTSNQQQQTDDPLSARIMTTADGVVFPWRTSPLVNRLDDWIMNNSDGSDDDDDVDSSPARRLDQDEADERAWLNAFQGRSGHQGRQIERYRALDSLLVDMSDRLRLRRLLSQAQAGRHYQHSLSSSSNNNLGRPRYDVQTDFDLPGLIGQRPLNPPSPPVNSSIPAQSHSPSSLTRPPAVSRSSSHRLKEQQHLTDNDNQRNLQSGHFATSHALDHTNDRHARQRQLPSSATSSTSFLRPGIAFIGHQTFEAKVPFGSHHRHQRHAILSSGPFSSSSLRHQHRHAPYAPLPTLSLDNPMQPLVPPADFPALPSSGTRARSGLDALLGRQSTAAVDHSRPLQFPGLFSSLDDSLRASERGRTLSAEDENDEASRQQWNVKVIIHSVSANNADIAGLMHAIGVPASPNDITTYFTGELIDPIVDGLRSRKWSQTVKMSTEIEYWARIGPFRGMDTNDLAVQAHDFEWVQQQTRGWLLMRWKEKDFVNVSPKACSLSIDGFYLVAINRATGELEGLYCDPSTPPYQRLSLSASGFSAPFASGSYTMA
ncbi:hypothetical protein OIO90_001296 [Microbotryomycetes sp. JL221]|nr:hypothetical protein OIO90_001296 [Microbotryomycetes sp. JL221]